MSDPTPPAGTPTPTPRTPGGSKRWQPPAPAELQALLPDDYTVEKLLGRGGMGAVYQGRRLSLDRPVAIKILSTDLEDSDTRYVERFKNEARAMAQLSHPGIVAVYGFGETADGLLYIVMEFIAGTDVHRMIKEQGRLRTEHAMAITAHVCDALAFAHERGIIHRDIKPANIMVGYEGVVKVADFGLAKMTVDGATLGLTKSGMAMGTLHYMAPEALILGTAVDHRADIYAVGVMLYQMLTGKLPQGVVDLPSEQVPGLDPRYDAIIAKAMSEDRDERYQSIRELRHDLDATLTRPVVKVEAEATQAPAALTTTARPQRPAKPRFSWRVGFRLGICIFVLGVASYLWFRPQPVTSLAKPEAMVIKAAPENVPAAVAGPTQATPSKPPQPSAVQTTKENASRSFAGAALAPQILAIQATKEQPFVNSLGMKFVPVAGTKVLFCIHETRRQDYAAYAAAVPSADGSWKSQTYSGIPCGHEDAHPVVGVSWDDARAFCAWLSKMEARPYRLPTDEEWSITVGIGQKEKRDQGVTPQMLAGKEMTEFPWGGGYPPQAGNYADTAFKEKFPSATYLEDYTDGFATTAPVMSFKPNQLGLYDLGGNVWEWCEDWYDTKQDTRVLRGNAWHGNVRPGLLSSIRSHHTPGTRYYTYGFRVVVVVATSNTTAAAPVVPPSIPSAPNPSPVTSAIPKASAPFTNSLGMHFVPVPGTDVLFCIHETRRQDYATYAAQTNESYPAWKNTTFLGSPVGYESNHPVVSVSWENASAFCSWLSREEGKTYRLPTDEEWSIAVGLGQKERRGQNTLPEMLDGKETTEFPWGGDYPPKTNDKAGNYADTAGRAKFPNSPYIAGYADGFLTTAPVMSFKPNKYGLYDLGGNVWEWCKDWMGDRSDSAQAHRVLRGGSWRNYEREYLLSSKRDHESPRITRSLDCGFRCVVEK